MALSALALVAENPERASLLVEYDITPRLVKQLSRWDNYEKDLDEIHSLALHILMLLCKNNLNILLFLTQMNHDT